ncbi:MAG: DHH family phosphoesterase [Candidatus Bathyarchaeota archaeon]|nr:DHH family phosphoesterase [Candidatus Bathyarchaeota archaeon]
MSNNAVSKEQLDSLQNNAKQAADLIRKTVENGEFVHVVSHLDADGLAAAGIIGKALARLGAFFRIRIERWLDEKVASSIAADKPALIIFADFGSGNLDVLNSRLADNRVIILDHHQFTEEASPTFVHVNPHLHGIDGSRDLSAAGVAYFAAKALDKANIDLAPIAVIGALGDIQDKYVSRTLGGVNKIIVEDAETTGGLQTETDLLFFGRETRPIHKALAYTTVPFIPDISGQEDRSVAFLASIGITPKKGDKWRALRDLSEEEKKKLCSALADHLASKGLSGNVALNLIGRVYMLTHEEPWTPLRDAREFSVLLNSTGRMGRAGLGVAICMGDRGAALEEASKVLDEYRRTITKYLGWLTEKPGRIEELNSIYVAHGEGLIDDKMIGTISSILSTNLPKLEKPLIAYSAVKGEEFAKFSARTLDPVVRKGLNLGEILKIAAEKYSGRGGGHNIAAGAQVPIKNVDAFIKLVDEFVKKQLEGKPLEG